MSWLDRTGYVASRENTQDKFVAAKSGTSRNSSRIYGKLDNENGFSSRHTSQVRYNLFPLAERTL